MICAIAFHTSKCKKSITLSRYAIERENLIEAKIQYKDDWIEMVNVFVFKNET